MSERRIVRIKFGSHLYGTATPSSDLDYKSVHVPSAEEILLQRVRESVTMGPSKDAGAKNKPEDVDDGSYSLQRYLGLLSEGQTVAIDMLFAPDESLSIHDPLWDIIRANRECLLTKRSAAFVGYCRTQANKYGIKGSRVAAAKAAAELFSAELERRGPTARVGEIADGVAALTGEHTAIVDLPVRANAETTERFLDCCNRKVSFNNTIKAAAEVYGRIYDNYGARARIAQTNEGIDWKALSHAVRVAREAIELLETHRITFPLPYAPRILEIKQGKVPYYAVAEEIEGLLIEVEAASAISTLPDAADREFIDGLVLEEYRAQVMKPRGGSALREGEKR